MKTAFRLAILMCLAMPWLTMPADASARRGRALAEKQCASCHAIGRAGDSGDFLRQTPFGGDQPARQHPDRLGGRQWLEPRRLSRLAGI